MIKSATAKTVPGFESFWQFSMNMTVLIGGLYLVHNVMIEEGTLALWGDLNASMPLTVITLPTVQYGMWNRVHMSVRSEGLFLMGQLEESTSVQEVRVPKLTGWKFSNSLLEVQSGFDDSSWTVTNKTSTNLVLKLLFRDGRVLYGEFPMWAISAVSGTEADQSFC